MKNKRSMFADHTDRKQSAWKLPAYEHFLGFLGICLRDWILHQLEEKLEETRREKLSLLGGQSTRLTFTRYFSEPQSASRAFGALSRSAIN